MNALPSKEQYSLYVHVCSVPVLQCVISSWTSLLCGFVCVCIFAVLIVLIITAKYREFCISLSISGDILL